MARFRKNDFFKWTQSIDILLLISSLLDNFETSVY